MPGYTALCAKFFFNAEKLVVFCHTLRTTWCTGLIWQVFSATARSAIVYLRFLLNDVKKLLCILLYVPS